MLKQNNFLFYAGLDGETKEVLVSICKKDFFEKNSFCEDRHLGIQDILPKGIIECAEGLFESEFSLEKTKALLRLAGFQESDEFTHMSMTHDPFIEWERLPWDDEDHELAMAD
jgi:hypothetical protein